MTSRKRLAVEIGAIVGGLGVAMVGAYALLERGCGEDLGGMCRNQIIAEYPSPDRRLKVTVFQRDCGATTGFSTQASLLWANRALPAGGGNIFVADDNHGAAPKGPGGGPRADVRWISDKQVVVRHHPAAHVFQAKRGYEGVVVDYETGP